MGLNWQRLSDKTQFKKLLDFGSESQTSDNLGYYVSVDDLISSINITLYVKKYEAVRHMYIFNKNASDYVRFNVKFNIHKDKIVELSDEFMCKFDLVRVVPPQCHVPYESYLRVMLKFNPDNSKMKYIQDEIL